MRTRNIHMLEESSTSKGKELENKDHEDKSKHDVTEMAKRKVPRKISEVQDVSGQNLYNDDKLQQLQKGLRKAIRNKIMTRALEEDLDYVDKTQKTAVKNDIENKELIKISNQDAESEKVEVANAKEESSKDEKEAKETENKAEAGENMLSDLVDNPVHNAEPEEMVLLSGSEANEYADI